MSNRTSTLVQSIAKLLHDRLSVLNTAPPPFGPGPDRGRLAIIQEEGKLHMNNNLVYHQATGHLFSIATYSGNLRAKYLFLIILLAWSHLIHAQELEIDTCTLTPALVDCDYYHKFKANPESNQESLVWSITDGALPEGINLNTLTGEITGVPIKPTHARFRITAQSGHGQMSSRLLKLKVISERKVIAWGYNEAGQTTVPQDLTHIVDLAGGGSNTLLLKSDGTVTQFGYTEGFLTLPNNLENISAISAHNHEFAALRENGTVVAWGNNDYGQTVVPEGLRDVVSVKCGIFHMLALKNDGSVVAWGHNHYARIPYGLSQIKEISVGSYHSLALKQDGTVVAWGSNNEGQTNVPEGLVGVKNIAAGQYHSAALKSDGTVVVWGNNDFGQRDIPKDLRNVKMIAAGESHTLALKKDGTVVAWGYNSQGQTNVPKRIVNAVSIAAGQLTSLALGERDFIPVIQTITLNSVLVGETCKRKLACAHGPVTWSITQGNLPEGLFLDPMTGIISGVPTKIEKSQFTVVARNKFGRSEVKKLFLSTQENLSVIAWGRNNEGQSTVPGDLSRVTAISAGYRHSAALMANGTVRLWGSLVDEYPVQEEMKNITAISSHAHGTLALRSNGTLALWGRQSDLAVPSGLRGVKAISCGLWHALALKEDGTVVAWGDGGDGATAVPEGLSDVIAIAAGQYHSLALKKNGKVIAWGRNSEGQCTIPQGLAHVKSISAAGYHSWVGTRRQQSNWLPFHDKKRAGNCSRT
jgi:alpha-tubulin suppressor-like RCC1 family protein